ncbi:MAG: hypothetical protein K2N48_04790 [Muribaculaceae bacterium]|nr:hypothetical protein [Muribaculaceae bacterium]
MAGKTLAASKPKLEQDLKQLLENAFYESEMTAFSAGKGDPRISAAVKKTMDAGARKKAQKFAEKAYKPLAQAIYDFVIEIGINLVPKGTLIAPQAPAGALPITGSASTSTQDITIV